MLPRLSVREDSNSLNLTFQVTSILFTLITLRVLHILAITRGRVSYSLSSPPWDLKDYGSLHYTHITMLGASLRQSVHTSATGFKIIPSNYRSHFGLIGLWSRNLSFTYNFRENELKHGENRSSNKPFGQNIAKQYNYFNEQACVICVWTFFHIILYVFKKYQNYFQKIRNLNSLRK